MTVADKLDKVDRLLSDASRATANREHGLAIGCTEWQAAWCPIHGDCCCENEEDWRPGTNGCKLHLPDKTPIGLIVKNEDGLSVEFDWNLYRQSIKNMMAATAKSDADCSGMISKSMEKMNKSLKSLGHIQLAGMDYSK